MDDKIHEAFFLQEFAALKAVGQFDFDRVPDGSRAGKADEGFGFGEDEIAQHGEACRDATGGGIGEQADEKSTDVVEAGEGALVLAICISDSVDSCMRAPPEQETMIRGNFSSAAASMVRVIFSPTTLPMEPIMNVGSMAASMMGRPLMKALPQTTASFSPDSACTALRRSL